MTGAPSPLNRAFARALRQARKAHKLTQEDFSIASGRTYISALERGLKSPTLEKIASLAETIKIHPLTLLTLTFMHARGGSTIEQLWTQVERELKKLR